MCFLIKGQGLADQCIDVIGLRLDGRHTCKIGEFIYQGFQLVYRFNDHLGTLVKDLLIVTETGKIAFAQTLGRKLDRCKRILDFMGNATGNLAPGGHALGLHNLCQVIKHQYGSHDVSGLVPQQGEMEMQSQPASMHIEEYLAVNGILFGHHQVFKAFLDNIQMGITQDLTEVFAQDRTGINAEKLFCRHVNSSDGPFAVNRDDAGSHIAQNNLHITTPTLTFLIDTEEFFVGCIQRQLFLAQVIGHPVERLNQHADFIGCKGFDLYPQVAVSDRPGCIDQLL